MEERRQYPIGIQSFEKIIEGGYVYVDKTAEIYNLVTYGSNYVFLSRPRRFGKSLLVSTLKAYFEGRKDLFEGLDISRMEKKWTQHPVLMISLAGVKGTQPEDLWNEVNNQFAEYEKQYSLVPFNEALGPRLTNIVKAMAKSSGQKVVILLDEYDNPLLNVLHDDAKRAPMREALQKLYGPIKDLDPYLRFVFITGITKFSQMSIFSALNNIINISMDDRYADIVGITKDEMLEQMEPDIRGLAEAQGITYNDTVEKLRKNYDGYKFSKRCPDIFNPFSLLNCFDCKEFKPFWFDSGTPTYLIEMLRKYHVLPSKIGNEWGYADEFDRPMEVVDNITPLLYHSGYLTIKGYNSIRDNYLLDIPNEEVRLGLMRSLLPYYVQRPKLARNTVGEMIEAFHNGQTEKALKALEEFLEGVPYCDNTDYEGHWQQTFLIIFTLFGAYGDVEVRTNKGRVDLVMVYMNRLYLIELKIDRTAQSALEQIEEKGYAGRFARLDLPIIKIGINFDTKVRNITWLIDE